MVVKRKWFSRTFLVIVGSIFAIIVLGVSFGFQTLLTWKLRHEVRRNPILALTPVPLPVTPPTSAEGTVLSHAGFRFEVPWSDVDSQRTKLFSHIAVYVFRSGRVVSFYGPSPTGEDLISAVEKNFGGKSALTLFGPEATRSNYSFHKTVLELTPTAMKPWMSYREAMRTSMLLTIKAISSVGGKTGLFSVQANGWKGFQFDDPVKKPKNITLEVYDLQDRHIEIIFSPGNSPNAMITQADIDQVVLTLAPVEPPKADSASLN
jgi:hypothetical protein